jgi:hypothetical protein
MFSRHDFFSRQGTSASAAGLSSKRRWADCIRVSDKPWRSGRCRSFLSADRGAYGDPDWKADVAAHAGTAAARDSAGKIPREERNR